MNGASDILLVDDQSENLLALEAVLAPLGHRLVSAGSGEEALKHLLDADFAVIVMDVRMPGLDGFETVELIKQRPRNEDVAVIFLTAADPGEDQITRGYSAGAVDYIVKPVDPDVLRSKVAMLVELQRKTSELRESEARFRAAFEDAPIGIGLSTIEGDWLELNAALCDLLGRSQSQLIGQQLWELAHPADREHERDAWRRLLRDKPRLDQSEKRFMRHDGEVVHALVNVSLTLDAHGEPLNYVWQVVDVTEQRRAEAERAAHAEAEAVALTLGKLQQVTAAALEHLDLDDLLRVLVDRVAEVFESDFARVLLFDARGRELVLGAATGFPAPPPDDTIPLTDAFHQAVLGGRSLILDEIAAGTGLDPMLALARPRALMAAPLIVKGRIAGVVELGTKGARRFTAEEESLLVLMADRAGIAIEHARAYEREVGTVEMLQRSLLPDRLPDLPGLRIAARYMPGGADVGGDWYDAIPLEGGGLGVAMGDVVGHGIAAASLMGQLRHAARAYAVEGHSPATVLNRLDRLVRSLEGAQMATLLYLVVEADLRSVRLASAGHVPPLVIGPDGRAAFLEGAPDPPLGVFDSEGHTELGTELEPGSTIVLYTDGLVEERGVSIDAGLEALRVAAEQRADPEELCDHLVASMLAIHPAHDDIAVLVLRALAATSESLHMVVTTDPTMLGGVRRGLAQWLRAAGADQEQVEVLQMACHEACSNSIEHGYGFGEGAFSVDARIEDRKVVLEVRDDGGWVERGEESLPHRGHGLPLIEALMEAVEVTHDGRGTLVRMECRLAREREPAAS